MGRIIPFRTDDPEHFVDYLRPVAQSPTLTVHPCRRVPFHTEVKMTRLQRIGLFKATMTSARAFVTAPLGYCSIKVPLGRTVLETGVHGQADTLTTAHALVTSWDDLFDLRFDDYGDGLVVNLDQSFTLDSLRKLQGGEVPQRELLMADSHSTTVTDIAMRFGFCHLGQFAADYRKAFQELPSETLWR